MTLQDIRNSFNRALSYTFDRSKNFLVFCILALCGLLVVFFKGLAVSAGQWMILSLAFLPIFLCAGVLFSMGIFLIRVYHDEIKEKPIKYTQILSKSWEMMIGASYFSVPIVLCYLLLWMTLGIFFLLTEIPGIGEFFGSILIFGPFLLNLGSLLLCLFNLCLLFYVTPMIALKGLNRIQLIETMTKRFKLDPFSNLFLGMIGLLPLLFIVGFLVLAAILTDSFCLSCDNPIANVVQWFFIMIPFTAILAPVVIFFFNFAAEAHILLMKEVRKS